MRRPIFVALFLVFLASLQSRGQTLTYVPVISTFAGGATTVCSGSTDSIGDGCLATQAKLNQPYGGSVQDRQGNVYIADRANKVVRRVDAHTGIITTIAGIAAGSGNVICAAKTDPYGDGCPATQAPMTAPQGLAFDLLGNLVIADQGSYIVRSVNLQTGIITLVAGTGNKAGSLPNNSSPQPATATALGILGYIAFDKAGNLYIISNSTGSVALVVATNGVIDPATSLMYSLVGTNANPQASTGDGGPATAAGLNSPNVISVDLNGNVYVGELSSCNIRKITSPFQNGTLNLAGAIISTFAGTGMCAMLPITTGGQPASTELGHPESGGVDKNGTLYWAQYGSPGDSILAVNLATNVLNVYAGTQARGTKGDGGPAIQAQLDGPVNVSLDYQGNGFITDLTNSAVRRVSLQSVFGQQAVGGTSSTQNVIAQAARNLTLQSMAVTPPANATTPEFSVGTLFGCSAGGALAQAAYCTMPVSFSPTLPGLRSAPLVLTDSTGVTSTLGLTGIGIAPQVAFTPSAMTTVAGNGMAGNGAGQVSAPQGGSIDGVGNVYFADSGNNVIRKIAAVTHTVTTVAGTGTSGYAGDGASATAALLNAPTKVVVDAAGNLYIVDTGNSVIRYVSVDTGSITTIAGMGGAGYTGDGGLATAAQLNHPQGLAVDRGGNLFVADTGNNVLRFFTIGGPISTFAGTGTAGYAGDGGSAAFAALNAPSAVTADVLGNLYIADTGNSVIRMISPLNQISTVAGTQGSSANSGDGGAATGAGLIAPKDVVVDAAGDLYIASGPSVRQVNAAGIISTIAGGNAGTSYSGDGGPATAATFGSSSLNLMLDGSFNLYIADTTANRMLFAQSATPSALSFTAQVPGTTGSPQILSLLNSGNSPLTLSNIALTANFALASGGSTACTTTTVLDPGQNCTLGIAFSPAATAQGVQNGTLVITDNALNNPASMQTIVLTGDAEQIGTTTTTVDVTPSSLVYGSGATVTVTALVDGGTSPTGSVAFTEGGTSIGTVALSGGKASVTLPTIAAAGTITITAAYRGDDNNSSSSGTGTVIVQPAVLTVTATDITLPQVAGVLPSLTYSIAGFVNGDTGKVVTGAPAVTTTATLSSPPGTYPITITQGTLATASYTFNFVNGTFTIPPPDFTLTATPTSVNVPAGQVGLTTLTVTPQYGYNGNVKLSCGTLPANVSCVFAGPPTGVGQGSPEWTQIEIYTGSRSTTASLNSSPFSTSRIWMAMGMPLCFFGVALCRGRRRMRIGRLLSVLLLVGLAAGVTSCSQGSAGAVAAAGTYQVVITAADASANLSHSVTFTLAIQ